jgi:hypothetical protein
VDSGRDDGAVEAQLPAASHPILACQIDDMIEQLLQGGGLDQGGPADEGGRVGHTAGIHATELAEDQAVTDPLLGVLGAPVIEVLDDQHAEDDLHGGGGPPKGGGAWEAAHQILFDALEELIVVQQGIELGEHGIGFHPQGRDLLKQVDRLVAVAQHGPPPQEGELQNWGHAPSTVNHFSKFHVSAKRLLQRKLVLLFDAKPLCCITKGYPLS